MSISISGDGSITGVNTSYTFDKSVSIAGTVSYEDVTSIDAVGIITAQSGIHIDDSIVHLGDTDTKIRFPAADTVSVETGGSERLRIDSSGHMGLGTNNPTDTGGYGRALDITGGAGGAAIYLRSANGDTGQISLGSGDLTIRTRQADPIIFNTNNGERLRIRSEGPHLLVGTGGDTTYNEITESSSNAGLVIGSGSMGNGGIVIRNSSSGTGRIYFADNSGNDTGRQRGQINYYHNGDYMMFAAAGGERLRIDSNGRLTLSDSEGIKLSAKNSTMYALDGTLSYWGTTNFVYLNGAGPNGGLRLNAAGSNNENYYNCIDINGSSNGASIICRTNNSEGLRISSAGEVTKPKQPGFYARRSIGGDGRAAGAQEWTVSGTGSYNEGGHFKTSGGDAGKFVAPVTGKYYFAAQPGYKQTGSNFNFYFRVNGSNVAEPVRVIDGGDDLTSHCGFTGTCVINLTAGQKFDIYIGNTHHVNLTLNYFCGYLMG